MATITPEPESEREQKAPGPNHHSESTDAKITQHWRKSGFIGFILGYTSSVRTYLKPFKPLVTFLGSWGIIILHFLFVSLMAAYILAWIPGLRVNGGNTRSRTSRQAYIFGNTTDTEALASFTVRNWLLPGDITTIISSCLVLVKLFTGSCPLVSGSISWKQSTGFVDSPEDIQVFPSAGGDPTLWGEYIRDSNIRVEVMTEAMSFSWLLYGDNLALGDKGPFRRFIPGGTLTESSIVDNVTIHCLRFDSITWEENPLPQQIMSTLARPYLGSNSGGNGTAENPIAHATVGNVGILDIPKWDANAMYHGSPPTATIFDEAHLVAFLFAVVPVNQTCPTMYFDPRTGAKRSVFQWHDSGAVKNGCYTFARIKFTAGVIFSKATVQSTKVLQGEDDAQIIANEFTNEAVFMMNGLMHDMALGMRRKFINMPDHTENLILAMQLAYVSCWNTLQYNFGDNAATRPRSDLLSAKMTERVDLLEALVTYWRVWLWLALQFLVTVSAILLQCFEIHWKVRNGKNRERGFTADALLLDTTAVYAAKSERRKARAAEGRPRNVQPFDLNTPLRVRLEKNDGTGSYMRSVYRPNQLPPAVMRGQNGISKL